MALFDGSTQLANIALTDTFNTWRNRTNQILTDAASSSNTSSIVFDPKGAGQDPSHNDGQLYYSSETQTLRYQAGANTTIWPGHEVSTYVYNDSGSDINAGRAVYFDGEQAAVPKIVLSKADADNTHSVAGVTKGHIKNGEYGHVLTQGIVFADTSSFSVNDQLFVSPTVAGELTNVKPSVPNYPVTVGKVLLADGSNGCIFVQIVDDTLAELRVTGSGYVDGNFTIVGDLQVQGTQSTISSTQLSVGNTFIYVGNGDDIANAGFTGSGLNDMDFKDYYTGTNTKSFYVRIDSTGATDTFMWSIDNFATQEANSISITGSKQALSNGISVIFNATTGHTLNDTWNGTVTHTEVDLGFSGHFNDGSSYTHTGLFRDATDDTWKFFNRYSPEVAGVVDTGHVTFEYADIKGKNIYSTATVSAASVDANTVSIGPGSAKVIFTNSTTAELYYSDNKKLETKAGGIDITGNTNITNGVTAVKGTFTGPVTAPIITSNTAVFSTNGAITIPVGNTGNRPISPTTGMLRFNNQLSQLEVYNGTAFTSASGGGGGGVDFIYFMTA